MMFPKYIKRNSGILHSQYFLLCACLIVVVFVSSCQQVLDIEIKTNDKRLLVDGEFTNDSLIHSVKLYCSGSLITGVPQTVVSGASIYVTDKIDTFYYAESDSLPGLYQTLGKCRGKGGTVYSLSITNIDIDQDGEMDSFSAESIMPVPVMFDSLVSYRGLNGDNNMAVNNFAYYKIKYNGPDYIYKFTLLNNRDDYKISDRLGSGELTRFMEEFKMPKVLHPESIINNWSYLSISSNVVEGDTISFNCFNFTTKQFKFLQEFDNNTNGDPYQDNMYDQLKIPVNVSTNIEPSDKAAGYFFVYSISNISKVFNE